MRRIAVGSLLALGLVVGSTGAAFGGETTGNGKPVPGSGHAASACSFSGRDQPDSIEDNPPGFDDDAVTGGHVQSYGQYVRAGVKSHVPSPGVACRGGADSGE
jgi:hypothetical protein